MQRHRHFASVIAIVAMALRALLPAGFMPAVDATGSPTLVLCTSQGAQTRAIDGLKKPAAHVSQSHQCPFGFALSMAAPIPVAPALAFAREAIEPDAAIAREASRLRGHPYLARGPPDEVA